MELKYKQMGEYLVPDLTLEESEETYGKYGMLRLTHLKAHRRRTYSALLVQSKLTPHLADIDTTVREQVARTVAAMKANAGVTEELKASNPLGWTGRMNALKQQAEEIVLAELIYK